MTSAPSEHRFTNRLAAAKSPYLLQHAHNPVDWYPWGDEAFLEARRARKPVFLSIGYSTCHWCHVMERESFSDERLAAILNREFIAVKVDREERPDIDRVYMEACMAMTGSGGWPLTVVMTPEKIPFFAATYIPREARGGRPGFDGVLIELSTRWKRDPEGVARAGQEIVAALRARRAGPAGARLTEDTLRRGVVQLRAHFDESHGGFGASPKFPSPHNLTFLLRYAARTRDAGARAMAVKTLESISRGGIHDHLGGGFHRYSVDEKWLVPHFEKMLYDQAMLAMAYTEAYQATGDARFRETAERTFAYVLGDMTGPGGGFYSAEDADSGGEEGGFHVWRPEEIRVVLGEKKGALVCRFYGVAEGGNFEGGASVLHVAEPPALFAEREGLGREGLDSLLDESRGKLLAARRKRVHPARDDKVLADWNGLMVAALAKGAAAFDNPRYAAAAARAAGFILSAMRRPDGGLLHRYRDGEAAVPAYLDDYAFLAWGLIELYEAVFDPGFLGEAIGLTRRMAELFRDDEGGGLFSSGAGNEELVMRVKEVYDGAYPSGNSAAAMNLLRLARLTGEGRFEDEASELMNAFGAAVEEIPAGHAHFLSALDFALFPAGEIVIAGNPERDDTRALLKEVRSRYLPRAVVLLTPGGEKGERLERHAPFVKGLAPAGGRAAAYVCRNCTCALAVTEAGELGAMLDGAK